MKVRQPSFKDTDSPSLLESWLLIKDEETVEHPHPNSALFMILFFKQCTHSRIFINQNFRTSQFLNLLISSSYRLISSSNEVLKSRFCQRRRKNSPLKYEYVLSKSGMKSLHLATNWIISSAILTRLCVLFLIFRPKPFDFNFTKFYNFLSLCERFLSPYFIY